MKLHNLEYTPGSRNHNSKRDGRGRSQGRGKTAGRGNNGQNQRSGGGVRLGFEGGQMPLFRRLPKRGFNNINRKEFAYVNLATLNERFNDGDVVTPEILLSKRIIRKQLDGLKVLGNGTLEKKLTIKANKFSGTAKEAIEAIGGTCEVL